MKRRTWLRSIPSGSAFQILQRAMENAGDDRENRHQRFGVRIRARDAGSCRPRAKRRTGFAANVSRVYPCCKPLCSHHTSKAFHVLHGGVFYARTDSFGVGIANEPSWIGRKTQNSWARSVNAAAYDHLNSQTFVPFRQPRWCLKYPAIDSWHLSAKSICPSQ